MVKIKTERQMWQIAVGLIIGTSLVSLLLDLSLGEPISRWFGDWLRDFSTDLAGSGVVILAVRWMLRPQPATEPDEITPPPEPTYFIDATEIPTLNTHPRASLLAELEITPQPEKRQHILNQLKTWGLAGEELVGVDWEGLDLSEMNLNGANLTRAKMRGCTLRGADLSGATLTMAQLIEADLSGADLSGAILDKAFLSGAKLVGARLHGATIKCSLWRVDLTDADLTAANLSQAELFHTNLTNAILQGVYLSDTKINSNTILPDGTNWSNRSDLSRFT